MCTHVDDLSSNRTTTLILKLKKLTKRAEIEKKSIFRYIRIDIQQRNKEILMEQCIYWKSTSPFIESFQ